MDFDKKLFELACRDYVLEVINESKYLRNRLSLVEHAKVYDWVKNKASYNQIVSIMVYEVKPLTEKTIKEFENQAKILTEGPISKVAGVMLRHPIKTVLGLAAASAIGNYIYRRFFDRCGKQCKGDALCIRKCRVDSIKQVIAELQSNKSTCKDSKNPEKCIRKFGKEIDRWNKKLRKVLSVKYVTKKGTEPIK